MKNTFKECVSINKAAILIGAFLFFLFYAIQPLIIVENNDKILKVISAKSNMIFSTRFIHSVQKTPVEEYFTVNDDKSGFIKKRRNI